MQQRPQINPGLRQVWRDETTLQIGLTPDAGVIVSGLAPLDAQLIDHLDGTHPVSELDRWARAQGADPARVRALLDLLSGAGVLTGEPTDRAHLHELGQERRLELAPDALAWSLAYPDAGDGFGLLAGRTRRRVLLIGRGRLASACLAAVARTAVPVEQAESARERLALLSRLHDNDGERGPAYSLVVLVGDDAVGTAIGSALLVAGLPHLVVLAGADRATIGPLVVPGRSACLRCLELTRTGRDPGWPAVAAQLDAPARTARGETSLTHVAANLVALQVACWVDSRRTPTTVGATLTAALPEGLPVRRTWPRHASCGCSWLPASLLAHT